MKMISFHKDVQCNVFFKLFRQNSGGGISLTSQKTRRLEAPFFLNRKRAIESCCHVFVLQQGKPGCYKFNISFFQKSDFDLYCY